MIFLFTVIICLFLFVIYNNIEKFNNNNSHSESLLQPLNTFYNKYKVDIMDIKSDSTNMTFLNEVNTEYKNKLSSLSYEQLSDKHLLEKIKKDVFYNAYNKIYNLEHNNKGQDKCQFLATKICKLPYIYISQTSFPTELIYKNTNSLSNLDEVNLKCYNEMYNCCKQSYN